MVFTIVTKVLKNLRYMMFTLFLSGAFFWFSFGRCYMFQLD